MGTSVELRSYGVNGAYFALNKKDGFTLGGCASGESFYIPLRMIIANGKARFAREEDLFDKTIGEEVALRIGRYYARISCAGVLRKYKLIPDFSRWILKCPARLIEVGDTVGMEIDFCEGALNW